MPLKLLLAALAALVLAACAQAQVGKSRNSETGSEKQTRQAESHESKGTAGASRKISANAAILSAYVEQFELASPTPPPIPADAIQADSRSEYQNALWQCQREQKAHYPNRAAEMQKFCRQSNSDACYKHTIDERDGAVTAEQRQINARITEDCARRVGPEWPSDAELFNWILKNRPDRLSPDTKMAGRVAQYLAVAREIQVVMAPQQAVPVTGGERCAPQHLAAIHQFDLHCTAKRPLNTNDPLVARYLSAVAFAHAVTTQAADGLALAPVTDIWTAAREAIEQANLLAAAAMADDIFSRARCVGVYPHVTGDFSPSALVLNCGAIQIDASQSKFIVLGRPTLSNETIAGRTVEVTLARDESQTASAERSSSKYAKKSAATNKQWQQRPQ